MEKGRALTFLQEGFLPAVGEGMMLTESVLDGRELKDAVAHADFPPDDGIASLERAVTEKGFDHVIESA